MVIFNNNIEYQGDVYPNGDSLIINILVNNNDLQNAFTFLSTPSNLQYIRYKDETYCNYTKIVSINTIMNPDDETKIVVVLKQVGITVEQYGALLSQVEELENCIIEMSEVVYGDEGDAV